MKIMPTVTALFNVVLGHPCVKTRNETIMYKNYKGGNKIIISSR